MFLAQFRITRNNYWIEILFHRLVQCKRFYKRNKVIWVFVKDSLSAVLSIVIIGQFDISK